MFCWLHDVGKMASALRTLVAILIKKGHEWMRGLDFGLAIVKTIACIYERGPRKMNCLEISFEVVRASLGV